MSKLRNIPALSLLSVLLLYPLKDAWAASSPQFIPDFSLQDLLNLMIVEFSDMHEKVRDTASRIMWFFAAVIPCLSGISLLFKREADFNAVFIALIRTMIIIGIFRFFILNGYGFACDFIDFMVSVPSGVPENAAADFSKMLSDFFVLSDLFADLLAGAGGTIYTVFLVACFAALAVFVINFIITYICAVFVSAAGIITLSAGVMGVFRGPVFAYIRLVAEMGFRMFTLCFIFRIGTDISEEIITSLMIYIRQGYTLTLQDASLVVLIFWLIAAVSIFVPKVFASVITSGSSRLF